MRKLRILLVILATCLLLVGCKQQENDAPTEETIIKYNLVASYNGWTKENENIEEIYEYYYVTFDKKTNEFCLTWKNKETGGEEKTVAIYTETENQYIVTVDGMPLSFAFGDTKDTLTLTILVSTMTFERVE